MITNSYLCHSMMIVSDIDTNAKNLKELSSLSLLFSTETPYLKLYRSF